MTNKSGAPAVKNWPRWLDPRGRSTSGYGYIINRLAGLGLTAYLFMHLVVLGKLAQGPEAYDGFIEFAHNPVVLAGEFLVILAVFLHGLNGLRIIITSLGGMVKDQKKFLITSTMN